MSWVTTADGVRLRCSDRGRADGPVVVLVHGWKGSHRQFDRLVPYLADDFRVVSYDLRGMGESDKPRSSYDFDVAADDLAAVLEQLGVDQATAVGSSMGCSVILQYMQRHGGRVGRVVLNNGPVMLAKRDDFPFAMPKEQLDGYLTELEQQWPVSEWRNAVSESTDLATQIWAYTTALQTPLDIALAVVREQAKLDHREAVLALKVPVLAAYSVRDPFYPPELGQWIAASAPDGRVKLFHESGHATARDEPLEFACAIREFAGLG